MDVQPEALQTAGGQPGQEPAGRTPGGTEPCRATLIVPLFDAAEYLAETLEQLENFLLRSPSWRLILVDDGSSDGTAAGLEEWCSGAPCAGRVELLLGQRNRGKGASVCRGLERVDTPLVAYTDCDLSYDLDDLERFARTTRPGCFAVASRVHPQSVCTLRPAYFRFVFTRHFSSRVFNGLVRALLLPRMEDTQAGLKVFHTEDLRSCREEITSLRFGFDLELLYIAHRRGIEIRQLPVRYRWLNEASSVVWLRDGVRLVADLVRIRIRGLLGRYR